MLYPLSYGGVARAHGPATWPGRTGTGGQLYCGGRGSHPRPHRRSGSEDVSSHQHVHPRPAGPGRQSCRRHRRRARRVRPDRRRRLGASGATAAAGDGRLVHQRRHGQRQAGRDQPPRPGRLPGGGPRGRSTRAHHCHRGRRGRLHQLPARRRVAVRRPGRAVGPGGGALRPSRRGPRRAGPGRVHLGQPHRADPRRERLVGELRRRPGPGTGPIGLPGQPRVLRQRHRRSDSDPGHERAGPTGRSRGARGRLRRGVRDRAGRVL